ncbi:MAG: 3-oxoacyl-[Lachnospiraceae bacterium]|nr:3-oxoacyl-[acyl-carrier-protein] reductase [Lachnospiraceae bacterium]
MLSGKVALVTGASRGIGREIAITLAGYGANVIVNYNGSAQAAQEVVDTILANGGQAKAVQASVAKDEDCKRLIEDALASYGKIDILVNNAGITKDNLMMKITEEDYDAVMDTNVKGTFMTIKHMYRAFLKQRGGRIINMSSVTGLSGNAGQTNYAASKAAIVGLTKSVAKELAARNVTCNAIAPGFIATEMTEKMSDAAKEAVLSQIPMKKVGSVKDIAETVAFLASDKAAYITGQVISVDGGLHM